MKWKTEPFIVVEDNVITNAELGMIIKEAKDYIGTEGYRRTKPDVHYNRLILSDKHRTKPIVEAIISQQKFWDKAYEVPDLAWQFRFSQYLATITSYGDNDLYKWHVDNHDGECFGLSFIIYLTDEGFTGGELCFSMNCYDLPEEDDVPWKVIEPKAKRLVIFPSYLYHRVNMVTLENKKAPFEERRLVISGHLRMKID